MSSTFSYQPYPDQINKTPPVKIYLDYLPDKMIGRLAEKQKPQNMPNSELSEAVSLYVKKILLMDIFTRVSQLAGHELLFQQTNR